MPATVTNIGTATSASGSTVAVTVGAAGVPAGVLIATFCTEINASGNTGTITDSANNSYVGVGGTALNNSGLNGIGGTSYCFNSQALVNGNTITYTKNLSGSTCALTALFITGCPTAFDPRDTGASNNGSGNGAVQSVLSGVPNSPGDIFLAALFSSGTSAAGAGASFTQSSGWNTPPNEANSSTSAAGNARVDGGFILGTDFVQQTYAPSLSSAAVNWAIELVAFQIFNPQEPSGISAIYRVRGARRWGHV